MLSYLESARIDANYRYFYGDLFRLMLNAGRAVSEVVEEEFGKGGQRICVVCGSGNNGGGDGIVAASELIKSNSVSVIALRGRESLSTDMLKRAVETYNGPIEGPEMLDQCIANCTIVIDAILGG
ncbi:hypothetical protein [Thermogymnomonas acidicola]|uniref:NAD(P)H-hydrate epimerase n=1 Tax=Thermogymnomonas acidicola TaxID=399579 RepID=UPI00094662AE|nr:NAD(P)H-hydrate epimerase [Thermogymnomonas acidicola]